LAENPNRSTLNKIKFKKEKKTLFTFMDLFCIKEFIFAKTKRNFFKLATQIIETKLSFEFQLNTYSDIEKIKLLILNEEQKDYLNSIPKFTLVKHINDIINFRNISSLESF